MGKRDRTAEIREIKERASIRLGFISYRLQELLAQWNKVSASPKSDPDFYVIRAVTILEVFTRRRVSALVNHDEQFARRADALMKDKVDYETLRNIHGRVITLGEIVAYNIPVNSFGQIVSHFETLLGKSLRVPLSTVVDRWRTEIENQTPEPIIPDYDSMAKNVTRLFELRHIVCHELPEKLVYQSTEVVDLLTNALRFVKAFEWVLNTELYGKAPLTQSEMNAAAANRLHDAEQELETLLASIRSQVMPFEEEFDSLADSQNKWVAFRDAHCDFVTFLNKGGSIRPLLWASRAEGLTKERISDLKGWLKDRTSR